ncbi:MAG TPA: sialidase family protein [Blastocatellia bacterium]|nr:sialidase family protein [Blastocatellia bacterium]
MTQLKNCKLCFVSLITGLVFMLSLGADAFSNKNQNRGRPHSAPIVDTDKHHRLINVEGATMVAEQSPRRDANKAWLLRPEIFDSLSAGGRRAALSLNGLLRRDSSVGTSSSRSMIVAQATPGSNVRVNNPDIDEIGATNSETSIAANGQNIIVSFNDASFFDVAGYSFSTDGGNTFTHKRLPTPDKGFGDSLGDGVVAFGPNGEIYYSTLADDRSFTEFIGVSKSTDNGATFSPVVDASTSVNNSTDFQDKSWLAVDRGSSSPFKGTVYVAWTDFTQSNGNFISCSRSTNAGESFRNAIPISPQDRTHRVQGPMPAVAPNGDLYVAYSDLHFNSSGGISIVKSTDGGRTFTAPKSAAGFFQIGLATGGNNVRTNSFPCIVVDKNGFAHIVYNGTSSAIGPDRSDVFYIRSTDGGSTFSTPLKINDDGTSTTQMFPSIAAASDGTLGVKWWDRRNDPLSDSLTDVYMAISNDSGASFGKNFRITDHNWVFGPSELGSYHGDYDGITSDGSNFFLSWSDERNSDPDAYFTQIPLNRDPNAPDFNISARKLFDNVTAGESAEFDFSTAGFGLSGALSLSASPGVEGITYTFSAPMVNIGGTAHLTVLTTNAVKPGTYLVSVSATGGGLTRSTNFRIDVMDSHRSIGVPRSITNTPGFTLTRSGIKQDAGGTIHLVYDDDTNNVRGSDVYYAKSIDGGLNWSNPAKISGSAPEAFDSTLTTDAAGGIYAVWTGLKTGQSGFAVFLSKSTDQGNTFSSPVAMSPASQNGDLANIAVDKSGKVLVTYVDVSTSSLNLFAVRSTDGGATFSTPVQISQPGEALSGIAGPVAFDSVGAAYVVYSNLAVSVPTIKLAVASDGQRFATPTVVSDPAIAAFAARVAVDRKDNLYVTFYNRQFTVPFFSREVMLIKSMDKGSSFRPQIDASKNFGDSTIPSLIFGKNDEVNLVWQDNDDNDEGDVFLARSTDGGIVFSEPVNLSANSGVSSSPAGVADENGNLVVAWTDDSTANIELLSLAVGGLPTPSPDFALVFNPTEVLIERGTSPTIRVFISRPGGFAGNVTVTAPDLTPLKIKLKGGDTQSTSGEFVSFRLKVKGGAPTGPHDVTFSGRDDSGRVRSATVRIFID